MQFYHYIVRFTKRALYVHDDLGMRVVADDLKVLNIVDFPLDINLGEVFRFSLQLLLQRLNVVIAD